MATVTLQLVLPDSFHDQFVATWDIINADLEVVSRGSLFDQLNDQADLSPGKYWARMQLPNGQTESRAFVLEKPADRVVVTFRYQPSNPYDWLGWASIAESASLIDPRIRRPASTDVHVQAWAYEKAQWSKTSDAVGASLFKAEGLYQLELTVDAPRLVALQVGGAAIASRFLILPPQGLSRVLIAPAVTGEDSAAGSIELSVSLANSVADHLARFLAIASPSGREGIDEKLARTESMDLLAEKRGDPLGAAVGGYFLVQDRSREPPVDWLRRLSETARWLADGPILHAYAALVFRRLDGADEAMHFLGEGAQRGYPVIRRGIELYLDACRMLASSQISLSPDVIAGARRFARVRAADTRQTALVTFFGIHPNEPLAERVVNASVSPSQDLKQPLSPPLHESAPGQFTTAERMQVDLASAEGETTADLFKGVGSRML